MISKRTIRNLLNKSLKKHSLVEITNIFLSEYHVGFIDCLLTMNKPLIAKRYFITFLTEVYDLESPEGCKYFEENIKTEFDILNTSIVYSGEVKDED